MALKPCRECGREISTEAAACPHCGAPVVQQARATEGEGAGTSATTVATGVFGGLVGCIVAPFIVGIVLFLFLLLLGSC